MDDLRTLLSDEALARLRAAYDSVVMLNANVRAMSETYPPLAAWLRSTGEELFGHGAVLAPRDRERCIIAVLARSSPPLSFAMHLYWGLMEGLSVNEVCATVSLVACYGGLPELSHSTRVLGRVLRVLGRVAEERDPSTERVFKAIIDELSPVA